MSDAHTPRSPRRAFLGKLGVAATALAGGGALNSLIAEETGAPAPERARSAAWDLSWVDKIAAAKYRVVFDGGGAPADNGSPDYALRFLDQFHEVYDTHDSDARAVIVFRQSGTSLGFNDSIWERYAVGERAKMDDPATKSPYRRNPIWKAAPGASAETVSATLETLTSRGAIVLVCNLAAGNIGAALARSANKPAEEVQADVRKNLIPGALLVPSGVFALIRAQNAGCAFLRP
jgi:hypothetical protein